MRLLALLLLLSAAPSAQPAYDFSAVDALLTDSLGVLGGGAALLVRHDGAVVHRRAFGTYTPEQVVPTASAAKWLSGGLIASLLGDGTLALDDSLGRFFPGVVGPKRRITVRQMFSHTSGIIGFGTCAGIASLEACVDGILARPLGALPGTAFSYGGASMQVAARAAELTTGERWVDLFAARIAAPLGMTNTGYLSQTTPSASGGMFTTVDDYGRFLQMVLDDGMFEGTQVLPAWTVEAMLADQTGGASIAFSPYEQYMEPFPELPPLDSIRYGLGLWRERVRPDGSLRIAASQGALGASPWIDFDRRVAAVLLVESEMPEVMATYLELQRRIAAAVDAGPVAAETRQTPALRLDPPAPSPARAATRVRLSLPASGAARLEVVDALGRVVATPLDGVRASGEGAVEIDLAGLAPGVYRLVLRSGGVRATQRLVVVR